MPRLSLVTGASGAIGKAIATGLALDPENTVLLVGRDEGKLKAAAEEIIRLTGHPAVRYETTDLGRKTEIRALASRIAGPVHLLVNNHCTAPRQRCETPEGIEMQWAVNVLGYYWMMETLSPLMEKGSRVVNVASYWAGGLNLQDPEFQRRRYDNDSAYRQSKQADRMLTRAMAELLRPKGITVNACHPGDVNSKLSNDLGFGGSESPAQGAATPLYVATAPELEGVTGKYFEHRKEVLCRFMAMKVQVDALLALCRCF